MRDLERVRNALPSSPAQAVNRAQRVAIYAHAAMLEVNSAGLSILFDRFNRRELARISAALAAIGAAGTLRDLRLLERAFNRAVARGRSRLDASEWLQTRPARRRIDRRFARHAAEIEKKLLLFCRKHAAALAA